MNKKLKEKKPVSAQFGRVYRLIRELKAVQKDAERL